MSRYHKMLFVSAGVSALAFHAPAMAQEGARSTGAEETAFGDIIVTARRREESLQNVPVTITALSGETLEQRGVRAAEDLGRTTPGLNVGSLSRNNADFYIRGQGPGPGQIGVKTAPGVVTYFAEVPVTLSGPGVFFDLQNIQVLKGPQGTLFGRNTTGGAVLVEPHKVTDSNGGYIQADVGNYDFRQVQGAVNVAPLPGVVALRLATNISRRNGYTQSINTGQWLDSRNFESMRLTLLLTPREGLRSETIVDYYSSDDTGGSEIIRAIRPSANLGGTIGANPQLSALAGLAPLIGLTPDQVGAIPLTVGGGASIACLSAPLPGCPAPLALPGPLAGQGGVAAALLAAFTANAQGQGGLALIAPTAQINQVLANQAAIGPRRTQNPQLLRSTSLNVGILNRTSLEIAENITLKNIISYRKTRGNGSLDFDGTPLPFLETLFTQSQLWSGGGEQFTEEFQIQGQLPSAHLQYILGLYHEHSWPGFNQTTAGLTLGSYSRRLPDGFDKSNALFAHAEWNPSSAVGVSAGVRHTWDGRRSSISVVDLTGACTQPDPATTLITCPLGYSKSFKALTYDVTLTVRPTSQVMIYGSYRRGYKAGGINLPAPLSGAFFNPEKVDSFEIGLKGDFNVGMPVRLDAAAFHDNYLDRQQSVSTVVNGIATLLVRNAPKAVSKGFEAQITALPIHQFRLSGFASYLDSHATTSLAGAFSAGRQLNNQPKWTYGINGTFTLPLSGDAGTLALSADWSWRSEVNNADTPGLIPTYPSYGLLNAQLSWNDMLGKGRDLRLFVTNITNKAYIQGGFPIDALGFDSALYGEPRMYGASLRFRFGDDSR